jgi:hypothetical protein
MAVERQASGMKLASIARQNRGTGPQARARRSTARRFDTTA